MARSNGFGQDPLSLSPEGPTGEWRIDVDRPPLGSLVGMLFRALVDRLRERMVELGGEALRPSHAPSHVPLHRDLRRVARW